MEQMPEQIPQDSPELDLRFAETETEREALQKLIKLVQATREGVIEEPEDDTKTERTSDSSIDGNLDETARKFGV